MAVSAKNRKRQQRARDKARDKVQREKVQKAIETMPPEYADDCKMWVSPPSLNGERPQIHWDIGAETHALIEAHAKTCGVTLDEVLYETGVQYFITRPRLYGAMKSAKINISAN